MAYGRNAVQAVIGLGVLVIVGGAANFGVCYLATHPKRRRGGEGGIGVPAVPPGIHV
jgi:hypothetical protein